MSTTNGAREPSMEEILASIRNIIAQDPSADPGKKEGTAPHSQAATTHQAYDKPASEPEESSSDAMISNRAASNAPGGRPEPAAGHTSSSTRVEKRQRFSESDDFADVFEEPLQRLQGSQESRQVENDKVNDARGRSEPTLPQGTLGPSDPTTDQDASSLSEAVERPKDMEASPASRGGFDFGRLRPSRNESVQAPFSPSETDHAPPRSLVERLHAAEDDAPAGFEEVDASRRKTVIAAMPQKAEAGDSKSAKSPSVVASQTPAASVSAKTEKPEENAALPNTNVGFLAQKPRPIDPAAALKSETGGAFFKAVAGETASASTAGKTGQPEANKPTGKADEATPAGSAKDSAGTTAATDRNSSDDLGPKTAGQGLQASSPAGSNEGLTAANIIVSSEGGRVRTLEDTVAELLRPLLREWLENNMPRIVENAMRLEVAESVKKQLKDVTGSSNGIKSQS
jgi:cell pole-organizing protein PopZ